MKKRKVVALSLCAAMVLSSLTGCGNVKTKSDAVGTTAAQAGPTEADPNAGVEIKPVDLNLLYSSSDETIANVVRDQLTKNGFNVQMTAASDGATLRQQQKGGNFDISIASWANPVGTPDYGCRGIWHSQGDTNNLGVNDPKLDELVEAGAASTSDHYAETYGAAEKYVVDEMTYMHPLYIALSGRPFSALLNADTVTPNQRWEHLSYVDESQNATRPLIMTQTGSTFFTWDPIRVDDQASGYALDHMYIHLVTLEPDWSVSTNESLSYNYAIADGNTDYYFILRDDCSFARIDDKGVAYDSGVMVSGEDVVYSLNRAMDKDCTPMHATYSMFESMKEVAIVTDIAELENAKTADGKTLREVLEADITPISELAETEDQVDNAAGKYQVVRVTTSVPYPQILNCLTFHGAGIVDAEWVENLNKDVDVAAYDSNKDHLYGDSVETMEGDSFNNQLSLSGNYVLTSMNDYQINFTANPGIRKNDADANPIQSMVLKLIADKDTALNSLRSGEVDFVYAMNAAKYSVVEQDSNLGINYFPGIRVYMLAFNLWGNSEVSNSPELRKAIASCINFEDIKAVQAGYAIEPYSPLSTCFECGNKIVYQPGDTEKYLRAYFATK